MEALLNLIYFLRDLLPGWLWILLFTIILLSLAFYIIWKSKIYNEAPFLPQNREQTALLYFVLLLFFYTTISDNAQINELKSTNVISNPQKDKPRAEAMSTNNIAHADTNDCITWDACTDFKTDATIENSSYERSNQDLQKFTKDDDNFPNPSIYLQKEVSPFYGLKFTATPLNQEKSNITIESTNLFKVYIGENDYKSITFLYWDTNSNSFVRKKDSKLYLTTSGYPSMKPETQFTFETIITDYNNSQAKVHMTLTYVSAKTNESEKFSFDRIIDIPAGNPNDFKTKVGVGLYANKSDIGQAEFDFLGVKEN